MIISEDLVQYMSEGAKSCLRIIDRLSLIEGEETNIYTIDLDMSPLKIEQSEGEGENKVAKLTKRINRKTLFNRILTGQSDEWNDFVTDDEDWHLMRAKFTDEFFQEYNKAYNSYQDGDWLEAKIQFENCQEILGEEDKPSKRFVNKMKKHKYVMPEDWNFLVD